MRTDNLNMREYKDREPKGIHRMWHENGQLESEKEYKDGKLEGVLDCSM